MRRALMSATTQVCIFCAGSVVASVHPFFTAGEVVDEPGLVGDWIKPVETGPDELDHDPPREFLLREPGAIRHLLVGSQDVPAEQRVVAVLLVVGPPPPAMGRSAWDCA